MVYKFTCGHVGRTNDSYRSKVEAFIRVAEIRESLEEVSKPCPDCKGR